MEWRLVATKGKESCRWQTADGSGWIALTLGAQGDITKVVVTSSDGRSEVVDGYEQGLNLARRWRNEWKQADTPRSSSSGPWLPPLPGKPSEPYGEDANPPSYPPESFPQRSTQPPPGEAGRSSTPPLSPTGNRTRISSPPDSPLSPVKNPEMGASRKSQSIPPARPQHGAAPIDDRGGDSHHRSWPPRSNPTTTSTSSRSVGRGQGDGHSEPENAPKPSADPSRSPPSKVR